MKYLALFCCFFIFSCTVQNASKNADLRSPCAGCDERVSPAGNLIYKV